LGGRRCSLHLQEPAMVLEGELLRFRLIFGIEWLFRRALSEWTTITVPYSRIMRVRRSRTWLTSIILILAICVVLAGPALFILGDVGVFALVAMGAAPPLAIVFGYILVRLRSTITVVYRSKGGKRTQVTFWVRKRATRRTFLDTLAAHRAAAVQHTPVPIGTA
jgi:hypothetical protein